MTWHGERCPSLSWLLVKQVRAENTPIESPEVKRSELELDLGFSSLTQERRERCYGGKLYDAWDELPC